MSYYLNEIRVIGTDSAAWFLFHPDDLVHRNEDPINWWSYDFAARREFTAGTLVGVETGSDGGFGVRLTNQELTEREKKYAVKSQSFRLRIRHDRLLIDGGYILPSEREYSVSVASDSPYWISVQNGDYRVTVYAIAWYDEPGAVDPGGVATENALTSYVAAFEAVEDLNSVNIPPSIPRLNPWDPEYTFSPNPEAKPVQESWEQEFAILVWSEIIFPGIPQELPLTRKQNRYVHRALHK